MNDRHKTWQVEAEPELRRLCKEKDLRIAELEAQVREFELRDWAIHNRPAVAAVPFKGRG